VNVNIKDCMIQSRFTHTSVVCNTCKVVVSVTSTIHRKEAGNNHIVSNDSSSLVVNRKDDCHLLSVERVEFKA
jgi:hypothetical protein